MYRLARRAYFSAAHTLYDDRKTPQENAEFFGMQVSKHGQGHNYIVEVFVEGELDSRSGMLMPLAKLDHMLGELTAGLDHKFLNYDVKYFSEVLPTAANLAQYCYEFVEPL